KVVELLQRCLRKDVKRRLRDVGDARIELEEAAHEPVPLSPVPAATLPSGTQRLSAGFAPTLPDLTPVAPPRRWLFALVGVVVLALLAGAGYWIVHSLSGPEESSPDDTTRQARGDKDAAPGGDARGKNGKGGVPQGNPKDPARPEAGQGDPKENVSVKVGPKGIKVEGPDGGFDLDVSEFAKMFPF